MELEEEVVGLGGRVGSGVLEFTSQYCFAA